MVRNIIALAFLGALVLSGLRAHAQSQVETSGAESAQPTDEDGFAQLDPATRPTVSGKNLLISAYSIILTIFLLYTISLVRRQRDTQKAASDLAERLRGRGRGPASS